MPIITTYLEEEIKQKLWEQGIVIWLDKDAHYYVGSTLGALQTAVKHAPYKDLDFFKNQTGFL